jgi:poly(3-hydroxybutyrate) depolymerase/peptidoglycan/LPS O-acetylase OafA/YrhL
VSTTVSDTDPQPAGNEAASAADGAAPAAAAPAAAAPAKAAKSRAHIIAFDMIRLIIMVFVVGVHTLALGGGAVTVTLGAVTTLFHTSRELFFLLTALVLTYNYGHRAQVNWLKFWRRRYWLVVPAYVAWTLIYYAFDGPGRGPFPGAVWHDLLHASSRYHMYFLLVTMQVYLVFPLIRWVLAKTAGHHGLLFLTALAYQVALTTAIQYHLVRTGPLFGWLNEAGFGIWLESYVLYVVGGAIVGWHFEQICAFTRRHYRPRNVALAAGAGVAAGLGAYFIQIYAGGATPATASAVFQPVVIVEALTFGWALLAGGLLWSDRGARHRKFFAAGSASSFGIFLGHPLVLQGVLYLASTIGFLGAVRGAPAALEVLALLGVFVPVVYGVSWLIASAARRTPLSLVLTGREWRGRAGRRLRVRLTRRRLIMAVAFLGTFGVAMFAGTNIINALERTTYTATYSLKAGGLNRSYEVIAPVAALPKSAPIIVVLSGINAPLSSEIPRDELVPYANAGQAELVYPVPYRESWNAGDCCGKAVTHHVNDLAFMKALVPAVDPGHKHPIYVVGYSNGGRLAYDVACTIPGLFDGTAIVKAMPDAGCDLSHPLTMLQIDSLDDPFVPYQPGDKGKESPPATVQSATLRALDGCTGAGDAVRHDKMTLTTWAGCGSGQRYGFAVWDVGGHNFPNAGFHLGATPDASQIIMSFFTKAPLKPLPT